MNVQVGKTTQNPLLSVDEWVNVKCPICQKNAKRETDTMDTFVDSSWYYARYTDPKNDKMPFEPDLANYWLPVDHYIGGIEHACAHLIYSRFIHKFMRDIGLLKSNEPFSRQLSNGMVLKDGAKMSKSKGNTVDPQEFIDRYGADTIRLFVLFASPPEKDLDWNDEAVKGSFRFLNRLHKFFSANQEFIRTENDNSAPKQASEEVLSTEIKNLRNSTHLTIKKYYEDMNSRMQFNTNIAYIMEHFNLIFSIKDLNELNENEKTIYTEACLIIPKLLYPFAPHLSEEIYSMFHDNCFIHNSGICEYNPDYIVKDEITIVVQINGKVRGKIEVSQTTTEDDIKKLALEVQNVKDTIGQSQIKKIIYVKGKLVSIVI
jgi:leucyl-tRNA synthetase